MLFNIAPFRGALFDSVLPPKKAIEGFFGQSLTDVAFFHPSEGIVLFTPSIRTLWSDAVFGASLPSFKRFTEDGIVPAERIHLDRYWTDVISGSPELSDMFVIQAGKNRQVFMLGFVFFSFPWGRFLAILPGETRGDLKTRLKEIGTRNKEGLFTVLETWIRDSETEFLVSEVLRALPEDFRSVLAFSRRLELPLSEETVGRYKISYQYRSGRWQREIQSGTGSKEDSEGVPPGETIGEKDREKSGYENQGVIHFPVFVGEVYSLGTVSVSEEFLKTIGLARFKSFLRKTSSSLIPLTRELGSEPYRYGRFWTGKEYSLEGLEEIARRIDVIHWQRLIVIPFWTLRSSRSGFSSSLDFIRERTDLLFYDPSKDLGCVLFREEKLDASNTAQSIFGKHTHVLMDDPVTVEEFLRNH